MRPGQISGHKQQHAQRNVEPSTVEEDKQPCLSTEANKSPAKPQPSKKSRSQKTEVNTGGDGDIEQLRYCGLTPEPSLNVSVMSLDSCISRPTPHSYMHVSDNSVYCLSPDAVPFVSQMCSSLLEEEEEEELSITDPYVTMSAESGVPTESDCDSIDSMCATNHRCPCLHGCEFGPGDNTDEHHEHGHYLCGKCSTEYEYVICETCVSKWVWTKSTVHISPSQDPHSSNIF